jgi:hypothetical protein
MTDAEPDPMLCRAVVQAFGDEVQHRLPAALVEYVAHAGRRPLEQCLRLPRSPAKRRALVRNAWLRVALDELRRDNAGATPVDLHAALEQFQTRGPWRNWAARGGPTDGAARLHIAFFRAIEAAGNRVLCRQHLAAVLKMDAGFFRAPLLKFRPEFKPERCTE